MANRLFHQCGHNDAWNKASFKDDKCGDGLIFSPVHTKHGDINKLDKRIRTSSLFDPQFYLPNSQKKKLKSYPFFPDTIAGDSFSTSDYSLVALEAARLCIDFQLKNQFASVIIPARFLDQMHSDYTTRQEVYTVDPFLKVLTKLGIKKNITLTLPLTEHMVTDKIYRTGILNWVTSFPEISGVYLIVSHESSSKQIQSKDFLTAYLDFLLQLRKADLEVTIGYCNSEGLLYSLIEGCDITFGSFENTRMFSIDKFVITDEERRGPKPRIFSLGLLNWIQFSQAKEIRKASPDIWKQIYTPTVYAEAALNSAVEPTFNQSPLYMHHFKVYSDAFQEVRGLNLLKRYDVLRQRLKKAIELYSAIEELPIDLEKHSRGAHIQAWLDAINEHYRIHLKAT